MESKSMGNKISFRPVSLADKPLYEKFLAESGVSGCEFSFANIYIWGRQSIAVQDENLLIFSQFNRRSVYLFPLGSHDVHAAFDAIIADARERGIACRISGITNNGREILEKFYPGKFRYHCDEAAFDYVYSIDDLADLAGKKYDGKRNHLRRFRDAFPNCTIEALTNENIAEVENFVNEWYEGRLLENQNADLHMERVALKKALRDREALGLVGLVLRDNERILAMSLASKLSDNTMDVHFEKARADIQGAYAAINCAIARYIREKYPEIRYLNREDDMGIEGLRRAKRSYYPHHMVEKCWACLLVEEYEY